MNIHIPELDQRGDVYTCTSAIIVRNEKILLGLRHYTPDKWKAISVWTTPGGRCDHGESIGEGLLRETKEETGIVDLRPLRYLGLVTGMASLKDNLFVFLCETNEEPALMEPEKFSDWQWFPLNELPKNFINPTLAELVAKNIPAA